MAWNRLMGNWVLQTKLHTVVTKLSTITRWNAAYRKCSHVDSV